MELRNKILTGQTDDIHRWIAKKWKENWSNTKTNRCTYLPYLREKKQSRTMWIFHSENNMLPWYEQSSNLTKLIIWAEHELTSQGANYKWFPRLNKFLWSVGRGWSLAFVKHRTYRFSTKCQAFATWNIHFTCI